MHHTLPWLQEGCPIHPICNGSPNWCRSVTDHDSSSLCVSLGHVGGSLWWCHLVFVCQFAIALENIHGGVMVCGKNVGRLSRLGRITTTCHYRDGWWRLLTVWQFAMDLENTYGGVMVCGENVSGLSQSGQIATTWHCRDGWWHVVTNIQSSVMARGKDVGRLS